MALDLYSKGAVDTLLAAKLSDAPSDGTIYGRKDGAWVSASGSNDWETMGRAGIAAALSVNFVSFDGVNAWTFTVGSGYINNNVMSGIVGVTQDTTNFYPFDGISSSGVYTASGFSFDSGNYIYLAFKDSAGNWHWMPNGVLYVP